MATMSTQWPDQLRKPTAAEIDLMLSGFWRLLLELRSPLAHNETLLSAEIVAELRKTVTDVILAANGIARPEGTLNLNAYLSRGQRTALHRTLALRRFASSAFVGQAVALIVIYRWYAPQLVDKYNVDYPKSLEEETLRLLSDALPNWPRAITSN